MEELNPQLRLDGDNDALPARVAVVLDDGAGDEAEPAAAGEAMDDAEIASHEELPVAANDQPDDARATRHLPLPTRQRPMRTPTKATHRKIPRSHAHECATTFPVNPEARRPSRRRRPARRAPAQGPGQRRPRLAPDARTAHPGRRSRSQRLGATIGASVHAGDRVVLDGKQFVVATDNRERRRGAGLPQARGRGDHPRRSRRPAHRVRTAAAPEGCALGRGRSPRHQHHRPAPAHHRRRAGQRADASRAAASSANTCAACTAKCPTRSSSA